MFLYSAHETNIALLLVTLDIFDDQIPAFGSYVLIEVHRVDGIYGFKVSHYEFKNCDIIKLFLQFFYQNYKEVEPKLLTIPGCSEFCPLDTFKTIVEDWIPDDDYCEMEA